VLAAWTTFPPVWCLLVYCLILICWKEPGWTLLQICGRERRNEKFSGKGHKIICASVARPGRRASARLLRQGHIFASLSNRVSPKERGHLERMAKSNNSQVAARRNCFDSPALSVQTEDSSSSPESSGTAGQVARHGLFLSTTGERPILTNLLPLQVSFFLRPTPKTY